MCMYSCTCADDIVDVLWPSFAPLQDLIAANQGQQEIAEESSAGGQRKYQPCWHCSHLCAPFLLTQILAASFVNVPISDKFEQCSSLIEPLSIKRSPPDLSPIFECHPLALRNPASFWVVRESSKTENRSCRFEWFCCVKTGSASRSFVMFWVNETECYSAVHDRSGVAPCFGKAWNFSSGIAYLFCFTPHLTMKASWFESGKLREGEVTKRSRKLCSEA